MLTKPDECEFFVPENDCPYTDIADLTRLNRNGLNFLHLNIRSFPKNKDSLKCLLDDLHFTGRDVDVVLLCETFLNDSNVSFGKLDGYHSYHIHRVNKSGGGVSLFLREGIKYKKVVFELMSDCTECLLLEIEMYNKTYLVGSLYRVPNSSLTQFFE